MDKKIKYAYFDLDGTLLNSKKELSKINLDAIFLLKKLGIKIGIATGRCRLMTKEIEKTIQPELPIISINGAAIFYKKSEFINKENYLPKKVYAKLTSYLIKEKISFIAYTSDIMYYFGEKEMWIKNRLNIWENTSDEFKWNFVSFKKYKQEKISKFLLSKGEIQDITKLKIYKNIISEANIVSSHPKLYDIFSKGDSKGKALKKLSKKNIINLNETIAFGDAENDIDMLENVCIGVSMKNSIEKIKLSSDDITNYSHENSGVGRYIFRRFKNDYKNK